MQLPVKQRLGETTLEIARLRLDGGTQPREAIKESVAREYGAALRSNGIGSFPPVITFFDGAELWLADGFHRVYGAKLYGIANIHADVREGTQRDAVLYSVRANDRHGLRRSNADKRRSVLTLLRDEEWAQWSDREIGRICGVDGKTVGNIRKASGAEFPHLRRGADGKLYRTARLRCAVCNALVDTTHRHYSCEVCGKSSLDAAAFHLVDGRWRCKRCVESAAKTPARPQSSRSTPRGQAARVVSKDQLCLPGFSVPSGEAGQPR